MMGNKQIYATKKKNSLTLNAAKRKLEREERKEKEQLFVSGGDFPTLRNIQREAR